MGYYACNKATIQRVEAAGLKPRCIRATVEIEDLPPHPLVETKDFPGFDENAVRLAAEWIARQMGQLSM